MEHIGSHPSASSSVQSSTSTPNGLHVGAPPSDYNGRRSPTSVHASMSAPPTSDYNGRRSPIHASISAPGSLGSISEPKPVIDFTPYIINGEMYIKIADHDVLKILVMGTERVLKSRQIGRDRLAASVAAGTASTNKRSTKQLHTIIPPSIPRVLDLVPADQVVGYQVGGYRVSMPSPRAPRTPSPFSSDLPLQLATMNL